MVRGNSPVPILDAYRSKLAGLQGTCLAQAPGFMDQLCYARFAWDTWDDLRIAIVQADRGERANAAQTLRNLRRKIGSYAYDRGWMPAFPEAAFWSDEIPPPPWVDGWLPMPRGN